MAIRLLHTPEGVRDIYDRECARKQAVQEKISRIFHLYGYVDIETPTFEFFDIFNKERGSVSSKEMFKFFDRDNNTLVLKPDMTPAIARCVTKYYYDEMMPIRLCYRERTFTNNTSYQGRLKEITQTGAELIGDASSNGDAEMVAMVIDCLKAAGLKEFQVELGQVEFFRGLVEEAGMDQDTEEALRELIENKNYFGVEALIQKQSMSEELKLLFLKLPELFGSLEQIQSVKSMTTSERALKAIYRLEKVHGILEQYGLADYISYDLGMLSKYQYYTGIIFKAYTYGTGEYVVTGGRYDKLLVQFGKDAPAVGFAIVIDQLMLAMARQKLEVPVDMVHTMILYEAGARVSAIKLVNHLRGNDMKAAFVWQKPEYDLDAYREYALRWGYRNILWLTGDGQMIQFVDSATGEKHELQLSDYIG